MSVDMQIFLVSPFLLIFYWHVNKHFGGLWSLAASSIATIATTIDVLVKAAKEEWPATATL